MIKGWFNTNNSNDILVLNQECNTAELLIAKFARSNNGAYLVELCHLFNSSLFHYLLSQSDHHTAEDVLQNTWLKVMKNATRFDPQSSAKNWLFTIARNTLIDEFRKTKRWHFQEIEEQHISTPLLSDEFEHGDLLSRFNAVIELLPFAQREAFILKQEGFSLSEIAQLTAEKEQTIKSRIRYAKQTLKTNLEQKL